MAVEVAVEVAVGVAVEVPVVVMEEAVEVAVEVLTVGVVARRARGRLDTERRSRRAEFDGHDHSISDLALRSALICRLPRTRYTAA